jgi:antitoxin CcdA
MRMDTLFSYGVIAMPPTLAPAKKATNITLSADVLTEAKALGINISQACDQFLRELVRSEREQRWQHDHAEFIAAYNETVEKEGLPLEEWRTF